MQKRTRDMIRWLETRRKVYWHSWFAGGRMLRAHVLEVIPPLYWNVAIIEVVDGGVSTCQVVLLDEPRGALPTLALATLLIEEGWYEGTLEEETQYLTAYRNSDAVEIPSRLVAPVAPLVEA